MNSKMKGMLKIKNVDLLKEDIRNVWNPDRFNLIRFPELIGSVENKDDFNSYFRKVLDMPIKLPHSDIKLPDDFNRESLLEIINKCVSYEKSINNNFEDYYMYLTVHHSEVKKGISQRRPGAHIDGMQGDRYKEKLPVCHSYLVSNDIPTRFFHHGFPNDLCEKTDNWFYEFDKVKNYSESVISNPYEINFMTAYNVHESTTSKIDTTRTFIRIEFSLKKFDRLGNSINENLDTGWDYIERGIPLHLKKDIFN